MDKGENLINRGMRWLREAVTYEPATSSSDGQAAQPEPVREATGTFADEDKGWRTLTGVSRRDLSSVSQAQMQKFAAFLWETNMLANRLIELPLAFLVAEGVQLKVADDDNQKVLDAFWQDPINRMDIRLPTFVRELAMFGEQCWPAYVNEITGHVRIGYLDPSLIADVIMDPGNAAQEIGVQTVKDTSGKFLQFRTILRGLDEELFAPAAREMRAGYTSGEAFYFAVNKFAAGRRGRSDLIAHMDWADAYDEYLFGQMERADELDAYFWDVKLTGADPETVKKRAAEIQRPGRGAVRVHNENEEWDAVAPALNAVDRSESARMFRNHALGGASMPEHWFGGGGDVNRAAASEMGDPFFKLTTMRQTQLKSFLQELGSYVLYRHALAHGLKIDWSDPAWKVTAVFPEMVTKDITKIAAAFQACVVAVSTAIVDKLISRETGLRIIATVARRLEIDIDPEEELERIEKEKPEPGAGGAGGAGPNEAQLGVPPDLIDDGNDA
ncbi:hypothetical protein ACFJGW_00620 [Burkholderiaceae bacterium UC74_6]